MDQASALATLAPRRRPRRRPWPGTGRRTIVYALLIAGGLLMMGPFLWMMAPSLKTRAEVFGSPPLSLPSGAHWENYARMWDALPFSTFFFNSVKLALLNTAGQLVRSPIGAVAFPPPHVPPRG